MCITQNRSSSMLYDISDLLSPKLFSLAWQHEMMDGLLGYDKWTIQTLWGFTEKAVATFCVSHTHSSSTVAYGLSSILWSIMAADSKWRQIKDQ